MMEPRGFQGSTFGGYEDVASPRSEALGEKVELWGYLLQEGSPQKPSRSGDRDRDGASQGGP